MLAIPIKSIKEVESHSKVRPNLRVVNRKASALEKIIVDVVTKLQWKVQKRSLPGTRGWHLSRHGNGHELELAYLAVRRNFVVVGSGDGGDEDRVRGLVAGARNASKVQALEGFDEQWVVGPRLPRLSPPQGHITLHN